MDHYSRRRLVPCERISTVDEEPAFAGRALRGLLQRLDRDLL